MLYAIQNCERPAAAVRARIELQHPDMAISARRSLFSIPARLLWSPSALIAAAPFKAVRQPIRNHAALTRGNTSP
jgi:hypothetical protein